VAVIDRATCVGGICIHHGAIPSKSLREAILYFTGFYHRQTYGARHYKDLTMQELMDRCAQVESTKSKSSSTNWKEIGLILSKVKRRSPTSIRWLCVKQSAVSKLPPMLSSSPPEPRPAGRHRFLWRTESSSTQMG
jgi:hypothetical protein